MKNAEFWKAAGVRAVRTFCQSAISMIAVGVGFEDVDWLKIASVAGVAALLSILNSLATGLPEATDAVEE